MGRIENSFDQNVDSRTCTPGQRANAIKEHFFDETKCSRKIRQLLYTQQNLQEVALRAAEFAKEDNEEVENDKNKKQPFQITMPKEQQAKRANNRPTY